MKDRKAALDALRETMRGFVGHPFTADMAARLHMDATELMRIAYDEGQAAMAHLVCAYAGTSFCRQTEDGKAPEEYDATVCRECNREGGFSI